jgi:hypothetical protein
MANGKFGRKREAAITALLKYGSIVEAAADAGISSRTLLRWLQDHEFQVEYHGARRAVVDAAVGQLQSVAGEAVEALRRGLVCGKTSLEIQAAQATLNFAFRGIEISDLAERLERLKRLFEVVKDEQQSVPTRYQIEAA